MINKQFSKCPACKQDEKYVAHIIKDGKHIEVKVCAKQCNLDKKDKK